MILTFRPIKIWPEGWPRQARQLSPFRATYQSTLSLLDREVEFLHATDITLQVAASADQVRLDGQLRADARTTNQGVILTVETRKYGPLTYACDVFAGGGGQLGWQANLRAIALGLEALRRVERYGIAERGQQYAGYREIGSGLAMPAALTLDEAARLLVEHGEWGNVTAKPDELIGATAEVVNSYWRHAAKTHHPDAGGDPETFRRLTEARDLLLARSEQ